VILTITSLDTQNDMKEPLGTTTARDVTTSAKHAQVMTSSTACHAGDPGTSSMRDALVVLKNAVMDSSWETLNTIEMMAITTMMMDETEIVFLKQDLPALTGRRWALLCATRYVVMAGKSIMPVMTEIRIMEMAARQLEL